MDPSHPTESPRSISSDACVQRPAEPADPFRQAPEPMDYERKMSLLYHWAKEMGLIQPE